MKSSSRWLPVLVIAFALISVADAAAAVTVNRAELSGTRLRLEGSALANRDITVDGVVMGRSDGGGQFRIERDPYTRPADCTVDVNDNSATPRTVTLSGCTPSSSPPPPSGLPAPTQTSPAEAASVTVPFTIAWLPVSDPSGIAGYNWQVSASSAFATSSLILADSTAGTTTNDIVSGLPNGTYFWRVQAVSNTTGQGAWSTARSFTVTGTNAGQPGAPTMNPPEGGKTTFHPWEAIRFTWSAVPGAESYIAEYSTSSTFAPQRTTRMDNIPTTRDGLAFADEGTYFARVRAVNADRVAGNPSNVVSFTVFYSNPVGPPPVMVAPANGATVTLPVTFEWQHVANPQDTGYEIEVARDPGFNDIEVHLPQLNGPTYTYLSLTSGTKYWRIRHHEGMSSPTTTAVTAWSPTRSFTVPNTAPAVTVELLKTAPFSGDEVVGNIQLSTPAPAGGSTVNLTSSNPSAAPVPSSVRIDAGFAVAQWRMFMGQVTVDTPVTITATLGESRDTFDFVLAPPSLKLMSLNPLRLTGGADGSGFIELNGRAPAEGAVVSLSSNHPAVRVPATMTVQPNFAGGGFTYATDAVLTDTPATITATWKGASASQQVTLTPQRAPASITLDPTTTTGTQGSSGVVSMGSAPGADVQVMLSSSHPDLARVPQNVTIPAHAAAASFFVSTQPVTTTTTVTISASGAGVTRSATLTLQPAAPPPPPPSPTPLPAPSLLSPANGARFQPGQNVPFDWSDVSGAASYRIQVGTTNTFTTTVLDRVVTPSQFSTATLPTRDLFWRVRAIDTGGTAGAWSAVRSLRIKN